VEESSKKAPSPINKNGCKFGADELEWLDSGFGKTMIERGERKLAMEIGLATRPMMCVGCWRGQLFLTAVRAASAAFICDAG
jgi:hypothetical protein